MPIYEYECPDCGPFEQIQSISAKPLRRCPSCGRSVRKLVSSASFRLKGGGWFADGYSSRKPADGKSEASTGSNGSGSSADKSSDTAKSTEKSTKSASKS